MKKPVFICLGDLQLRHNNKELISSLMKEVFDYCLKKKINKIVINGDILDDRSNQSIDIFLEWFKILNIAKSLDIVIYMIPGNHDKMNLDSEDSILDYYPSIGFDERFKVIKNESRIIECDQNNYMVWALPYFREGGSYLKRLKNIIKLAKKYPDQKHILITHIAIAPSGDKKYDHWIGAKAFKFFYLVFSGHFHNRMKIDPNVHYIGSICPHDFSEDNDKGFMVFYEDGTFSYETLSYPKRYTTSIDIENLIEEKENILKNSKKIIENGDFLRIIVEGDDTLVDSFDTADFKNSGINIQKKLSFIKIENEKVIEPLIFNRKLILNYFNEYANQKKTTTPIKKIGKMFLENSLK